MFDPERTNIKVVGSPFYMYESDLKEDLEPSCVDVGKVT